MERVLISIGSNLCDPLNQVTKSLYALSSCSPYIRFVACSSFYRSLPLSIGGDSQPDFLNVVAIIETIFSPLELLDYIHCIEKRQGRIRNSQQWIARTLDIDILLFGDKVISTPQLIVPHYDMFNREFVLYPLFELIPNFRCLNGKLLFEYLNILPKNNLRFWSNS